MMRLRVMPAGNSDDAVRDLNQEARLFGRFSTWLDLPDFAADKHGAGAPRLGRAVEENVPALASLDDGEKRYSGSTFFLPF
jgi:hypothetical protein